MPIGVMADALSVALGGLTGAVCCKRISEEMKEKLTLIFGLCSMGIGISSIVCMKNLPAVVLAMVAGTALGVVLRIGRKIEWACGGMQKMLNPNAEENGLLVTAMVLFCASGTGIYGAVVSGVSGDHAILLSKAILDFCTAMIFACTLGRITAMIAVPQIVILMVVFMTAKGLDVAINERVVDDFKACGGMIMLATGWRIARIRDFPLADMLPALVLIWLFSGVWMTWVVPIL